MNSENSKTSEPHRLLLNFSDKINLKRSIDMLPCPILTFTIHGKILKSHKKYKNLKHQL